MMKTVADTTRPYNIKTIVSLNPIMVDGTGMCGGCRVQVGDETKFACVDGPEFDGHLVDFVNLMERQRMYRPKEEIEKDHICRLAKRLKKWRKNNMPLVMQKHEMPEQDANVRRNNFDEVALGYTEELALAEANRCLHCKVPHCRNGCPVDIDIPAFIAKIKEGDFEGANAKSKKLVVCLLFVDVFVLKKINVKNIV